MRFAVDPVTKSTPKSYFHFVHYSLIIKQCKGKSSEIQIKNCAFTPNFVKLPVRFGARNSFGKDPRMADNFAETN